MSYRIDFDPEYFLASPNDRAIQGTVLTNELKAPFIDHDLSIDTGIYISVINLIPQDGSCHFCPTGATGCPGGPTGPTGTPWWVPDCEGTFSVDISAVIFGYKNTAHTCDEIEATMKFMKEDLAQIDHG